MAAESLAPAAGRAICAHASPAGAAGKYQIDKGETLFVGGLFGTGGAFIGGLIAAPFHHWHTVYASP